jgi:hypothetical protein
VVAGAGLLVRELTVGLHRLKGLEPLGTVQEAAEHSADAHNLHVRDGAHKHVPRVWTRQALSQMLNRLLAVAVG